MRASKSKSNDKMRNYPWIVDKYSTLKSPGAFPSPAVPAFAGVFMLVWTWQKEREKGVGEGMPKCPSV